PSTPIGMWALALFSLDALALSLHPAIHLETGAEPWLTLVMVPVAVGVLFYRGHMRRVRFDLIREQTKRAVVQHIVRVFVAIRDFANTPMQTLMLTSDLLANKDPDNPLVQRTKRAVEQLSRLNQILAAEEKRIGSEWQDIDASFDALREIE